VKLALGILFASGALAGGLAEMKKLSDAGKPDDALAAAEKVLAPGKFAKWREEATAHPGWKRTLVEAADPLFAAVGLSDLSPVERAAVHYARGVVLAVAEKRGEAGEAFEKARALAGPGDLRLDSTYDLAWTALAEGEVLRKQIPELGGTAPAAVMPPTAAMPPAAGAPGAPPAPDALQLAKAAYLVARERFVERLKADASDLDSRANVELAQKRLKELAEIEKKREEEKQKQEQQKKDQKDQDQKDKGKQDKDDKNQQNKDDAKDPQKDDKSEDQKKKDEQQKQQEEQQKEGEDKKKDAKPDASKEQQLTKEEIMRLLDTLKDREEEGKRLLEMRKRASRARVKKDW
jgi:hypothetical protein